MPLSHTFLGLAGDGFGDTLALPVAPGDSEALEQVAAWLEARVGQVDELRLLSLIAGEPSAPLCEALVARGWCSERIEGNPLLDLRPGWESLTARVGKNLRHDVQKKKRRLAEAGLELDVELIRRCDPGLLEELEELARRRFDHEGHKSVLLVPARRAFLAEACPLAEARGVFACLTGRRNGRLQGYRLGFLQGGVFFDWITSYDPALFPYSIGKLLLWDLVEKLCADGAVAIDFMAGEEDYKLKWMPEVRDMHRVFHRRRSAVNLAREWVRRASRVKATWTR